MVKVITVSREFGSGGRELAKRLADALKYSYIDKEIVTALSKETDLSEEYLHKKLEKGVPVTYGRSFSNISSSRDDALLLAKQHKIIKEIAAEENCVIVGRGADSVLSHLSPFRIFVYADLPSKIERCRERADYGEDLSDKKIEKKIKEIDKARKKTHDLYSVYEWGDKVGYDLCINTSGLVIEEIIPQLADYIKKWFEGVSL